MKNLYLKLLVIISTSIFCLQLTATEISADSLEMRNASQFNQHTIVGGQPSVDDLNKLKKSGVKRIINLRGLNEFDGFNEEKQANLHGINYVAFPINGGKDVTKEAAIKFSELLGESNETTLVHCASGNRVGALYALKAYFVDNKTKAEALSIGKKAGLTRLSSKVEGIIDNQ